jgi:hypothetical protein
MSFILIELWVFETASLLGSHLVYTNHIPIMFESIEFPPGVENPLEYLSGAPQVPRVLLLRILPIMHGRDAAKQTLKVSVGLT